MKDVACFALALFLAGCTSSSPQPQAATPAAKEPARPPGEVTISEASQRIAGIALAPVEARSVSEVVSATGELTVNEDRTWSVGSHIEGRVASVLAKPGDFVKQGAILARMHSHEVHDSRADYRRATDELARARAALLQTRRIRDRAARLLELKAASKQDLELAEGQLRESEISVRNAETEQSRVRTHMTEYLEVAVEDKGDDHVPIKAPASGTVLERKASAGTVVTPGQEVFRMTDVSSLWMIASVNESDLAYLRVGQPVRVLVRAYPERTFRGRILRLGEEMDATTRTLKVRVLVPNEGGLLKPEMYATAEIERTGSRVALYVPESAVQDLNGNRVVFVSSGPDRFRARPVEVGRIANGAFEVTGGLKAGERIVTRGSFVLKSQLLRSAMEEE